MLIEVRDDGDLTDTIEYNLLIRRNLNAPDMDRATDFAEILENIIAGSPIGNRVTASDADSSVNDFILSMLVWMCVCVFFPLILIIELKKVFSLEKGCVCTFPLEN